jgi:hypothetical protein
MSINKNILVPRANPDIVNDVSRRIVLSATTVVLEFRHRMPIKRQERKSWSQAGRIVALCTRTWNGMPNATRNESSFWPERRSAA